MLPNYSKAIKSLIKRNPGALKALKLTAAGTAAGTAVGGAGYGGYKIGYRGGAENMGDAMAGAFAEQNAIENKSIVNRFNRMNQIENSQLAQKFYRAGLIAGSTNESQSLIKTSSDLIYEEAFFNELEKTAIAKQLIGAIRAAGKIVRPIAKSFKSAGKSIKHYARAAENKTMLMKNPKLRRAKSRMAKHLSSGKSELKKARIAGHITGGAVAGYAAARAID